MSRSRRTLLLTLLLAVVVVACDSGDGTAADVTPESTATATVAPPPETPIPTVEPTEAPAGVVSYVALGDSLATGAGASTSYVAEYAAALEARTRTDIEVTNLAVNGWTSTDLLEAITGDEAMRTAVAGADLVTVDIGANDLLGQLPYYASGNCGGDDNLQCLRDAIGQVEQQWATILDEIIALREGNVAGIATIDLYQPFVGNPRVADDLDVLRPVMADLNAVLAEVATARDIPVATVHEAFHGADGTGDPNETFLISVDGLHPSNAGHQAIAQELLELDVEVVDAG